MSRFNPFCRFKYYFESADDSAVNKGELFPPSIREISYLIEKCGQWALAYRIIFSICSLVSIASSPAISVISDFEDRLIVSGATVAFMILLELLSFSEYREKFSAIKEHLEEIEDILKLGETLTDRQIMKYHHLLDMINSGQLFSDRKKEVGQAV
jgi:hypothetical protein